MDTMEPNNMDTSNEQTNANANTSNTEDDTVAKEIVQQNPSNNPMPRPDITNNSVNTVDSEVVATNEVKVSENGKPVIAEVGKYHSLKRELDDSENDVEDVDGELAAKRTCTDIGRSSEDNSGPEVFARSRMALCESLPYYRAYKSSLYTQNCVARGFYMDAAARDHDIFKAQVIVTSVGGGRDLDDDNKRVRVGDMSDASVPYRAIKQAMDERTLIPVIVGRNHPSWPVSVEHNFNVLDFFKVTDLWAELNVIDPKLSDDATDTRSVEQEVKTIRVFCFRLEKVDLQKPSWWDHNPASYVRGPAVSTRTCSVCTQEHKHILDAGWTCLNHNCSAFFKDQDGNKITDITYSAAFLEERTEFIGPIPSLKPAASIDAVNGIGLYGSEAVYRSGIVCTCGGCVSRVFWNRWSCEHCGKEVRTQMVPYPKKSVQAEEGLFNKTVARLRKANHVPDNNLATKLDTKAVKHREIAVGLYKASQFLLPDANGKIIGSVTILRANETIRERGPDKMFDTLSVSDIGLRRNPVSGGHGANEGLSRHFGINWGAPYKFGVTVNSKGFADAPETILMAVQQMRWAGATAVPIAAEFMNAEVGPEGADVEDANVNFNECLSLGYMEDDMIRYHDDGEKECGPTVATISLGAPAIMSFRPKKKSGMEAVVSVPPKAKGKDFSAVLAFPLYHGDITVMHGSRIHGLYEHQVEPAGGRRFALTCRYMDPTKMKTDDERQQARVGGTLPARAAKYTYFGDGYLTTDSGARDCSTAQDTSTQSMADQVIHAQNARLPDVPVANTLVQDFAPNGAPQHDSIAQGQTPTNYTTEPNETTQPTIGRYNFRARRAKIVYKDDGDAVAI